MAIVVDGCPQCGASVPPTAGTRIRCAYCGSSLIRLGMPPVDGGPDDEADPLNQWGVRMRRAVCVDGKYGVPVFEWLIPADWGFRGQVWWRGSLTVPATVVFRAWNPEGSEQIECLPTISNIWTTSPMTSAMAKLGKVLRSHSPSSGKLFSVQEGGLFLIAGIVSLCHRATSVDS